MEVASPKQDFISVVSVNEESIPVFQRTTDIKCSQTGGNRSFWKAQNAWVKGNLLGSLMPSK